MVFVKNWPFFHVFILTNIGQENVFYNILERKNAFYAIKTTSPKSRKIDIFPKGLVHGFCQKLAIFPFFYFRQENVFYNVLEQKNGCLSYENNKSKKSKN